MNHFKAAVFLCGYGGSREVMLCRFAGRLTHETIIRKPAIPTPSPIGQSVSERCLGRQKRPAGARGLWAQPRQRGGGGIPRGRRFLPRHRKN